MSNKNDFFPDSLKSAERLMEKYRGLMLEDLEAMNPEYSCVICAKFLKCGKKGCACENHKQISEEQFAEWYDF